MSLTYNERLNITPGRYPIKINVNQYDDDFSIVFSLYSSSGTLVLETGTTAVIRGTKRDGNGYSAEAVVDGSTVTVAGDVQLTAVAGEGIYELVLYKNHKQLATANFILQVERAALDKDTIVSESIIRELIDVTDRALEIVDAAHEIEDTKDQLTSDLATMRQLHDEAVSAAGNAANAISEELKDDIRDIKKAKLYFEEHLGNMINGDEVSY